MRVLIAIVVAWLAGSGTADAGLIFNGRRLARVGQAARSLDGHRVKAVASGVARGARGVACWGGCR
ncbi:MAG: hypothetical protein RL745_987 [Actinomycetota bacterium]